MIMGGSGLSLRQERALAVCPKFSSSISIPCSIFIIYEVIRDHFVKGKTTAVQRALVGMSLVDIMASSAWFMSTWAVPEGSFAYATGNRATCNYQGFLLQLAVGAPLYNSSLALFYLLMIKQRWTDEELKKIELLVHGFILSFTFGTSILLLFLEQYNHIGAVCWVQGEPSGCGTSTFQGSDVPCERGEHAWAWGLALFYGPLWLCVVACCTSMVMLFKFVRKTHSNSRRYSTAIKGMQHSNNRSARDEQKVAVQAILFSFTFLITWMPSTLWSIAHWFNWSHYGLDLAAAISEPLQGFWNLMIFLKNRPQTIHRIRSVVGRVFPCCLVNNQQSDRGRQPPKSFVSGLRGSRLSLSRLSGISGSMLFSTTRLSTDPGPSTTTDHGSPGPASKALTSADDFSNACPFGTDGTSSSMRQDPADFRLQFSESLQMSDSSLGSVGEASFLEEEDQDKAKEIDTAERKQKKITPSPLLALHASETTFSSTCLLPGGDVLHPLERTSMKDTSSDVDSSPIGNGRERFQDDEQSKNSSDDSSRGSNSNVSHESLHSSSSWRIAPQSVEGEIDKEENLNKSHMTPDQQKTEPVPPVLQMDDTEDCSELEQAG